MKKLQGKLLLLLVICLVAGLFAAGCTKGSEGDTIGDLFSDIISEFGSEDLSEAGAEVQKEKETSEDMRQEATPDENGSYTSKDDVALYIHLYGKLPCNFITKKEAEKLGWSGGSLEPYAPGKCIGGSHFGNYEEKLPDKEGRSYTECDIDTLGAKSRGAKRIVFSNDGLIYYTEDHYETFELLYGEE